MNLYDIRLVEVRANEIHAKPFAPSETDDGYDAKLSVEFVGSIKGLAVGDEFEVSIDLATLSDGEPFFTMTMIGTFVVLAEPAIKDLTHANAPYEIGSLLYPYIRNLAKPIIEYLGASAVDIPFAPPAPPQSEKKAVRRKKLPSA